MSVNDLKMQISCFPIRLKGRWKEEKNHNEHIRKLMRLIHTDVLRTDRTFGFYATSGDTNVNLQTLYHILLTFCVSHPNIPYCQGFSLSDCLVTDHYEYSFLFRYE